MPLLHRKGLQLLLHFILYVSCISPISLRGSSEYAIPGQPYTLICDVPEQTVSVSFWRTPVPPSTQPTRIGEVYVARRGGCYNGAALGYYNPCDPAVCSCINDGTYGSEFSWTFTPNNSMDNSIWYCVDRNNDDGPHSKLQFAVPVTSVALQNPPNIGSDLTVIEGRSTSLVCVTSACRPSANVLWYIGGTNYTSYSNQTVNDESGNLHITTSTLTFKPNRTMNGKRINCSAYNYGNNTVTTINIPKLKVILAPEVVRLSITGPMKVTEGAQVPAVTCSAHCFPSCNYMWSRLNGGYTILGSSLNLGNVTRNMAGIYICTASNQYGNAVSDNFVTIVNYGAGQTIAFTPESTNYTVAENTTLQPILCSAQCNPICDIIWDKIGGKALKNPLTLGTIDKAKAGFYICRASNVIKSISKLLTINIKGEDGYKDKRQIDGTTDNNTAKPNTASIVLFVLSFLILGVAVTFSIVFYIRCVRQTTTKTEEGCASRNTTNEYDDVQTVTVKAGKETDLPMTSVYQTLSERDKPSHYDYPTN